MTWDLANTILAGEIVNTCANQVHGWLRLAGADRPVYLNLTGNLCCDIAGRRVTFENQSAPFGIVPISTGLSRQQIGPTGDITLINNVLTLEWYSQDGHVFSKIPTCNFKVSDRSGEFDEEFCGENCLLPIPSGRGLFREMTSLPTKSPSPVRTSPFDPDSQLALLDSVLDDDPASQTPIRQLISQDLRLPKIGSLGGDGLQRKVKEILAHLALFGITLEMCHHFRPVQAFEMLHRMVMEDSIHPQSPQTGFIVHYLTFENCADCLAEEETWVQVEEDVATEPPAGEPLQGDHRSDPVR